RVGAAPDQALAQRLRGGRRDEDLERLGQPLAHLPGPLDLDLEHEAVARPLDLGARGAVVVAGVHGVLEELVPEQPLLELLLGEEVVVASVDLAGPRRPGGGRDRQREARNPLQKPVYEGALADAGGPSD